MKYVPGIKDAEKIALKSQCNLIWSSQNGERGKCALKYRKLSDFLKYSSLKIIIVVNC